MSNASGGGSAEGGEGDDVESKVEVGDLHVSFPMSPELEPSATINFHASIPRGSLDASSYASSGSSEEDRLSPLQTIKTSVVKSTSTSTSTPSLRKENIPRPPALLSVSSGAFQAAGVEYTSSKKRKSGGLLKLKGLGKSLKKTLSRTLSGTDSGHKLSSHEGPSTATEAPGKASPSPMRGGGGVDLPSLGVDGAPPPSFSRNRSAESHGSNAARRVSHLLWDLGTSLSGMGGHKGDDLCASDHDAFGDHHPSPFPHLQSAQQRQRNMSLYNPHSLAAVVEAEEAKERARERREMFQALCNFRICAAIFLFAGAVVGATVGGMALARERSATPATSPAVRDSVDSGKVHQGKKDEGFGQLDAVAKLEAECTAAKVRQWKGYRACHDLCESRYCCFVEDWDAVSCATSQSEHCPAYKKHCSILTSVDPIDSLEDEQAPGGDDGNEQLASVKGQGQGDVATESEVVGGDGEGHIPPPLVLEPPDVEIVSLDTHGVVLAKSSDEDEGE